MMYLAGFDITEIASLGTITLATAGKSNVVITLSSILSPVTGNHRFYHYNATTVTVTSEDEAAEERRSEFGHYTFGASLQTYLRTEALAQSWVNSGHINVSFSHTTGHYTIAYADAAFSISWSTTNGRKLCGFSGNVSGTTTYTGDQVPLYAIKPTLTATSLSSPDFEDTGIASHVRADNGAGFGIGREVAALKRTWIQQYEAQAIVMRREAATTHPWTFQDLFDHCRQGFPFIVQDGFGNAADEAFSLSSDGATFKPQESAPAFHTKMHVPFDCYIEGSLSTT